MIVASALILCLIQTPSSRDSAVDLALPVPATASTAEGLAESPDDDAVAGLDDLGEPPAPTTTVAPASGPRYTADLSDAELAARWQKDRRSLGSLSIGPPDAGRLVNGATFPEDPRWTIVDPLNTYGTQETVAYLTAAVAEVARRFPGIQPLRINHISAPEGGYLPPHITHQVGRDVDLGFYRRDQGMDLELNWALLRALVTLADVELVLVDRRIQKQLYDFALAHGEDRGFLDSLFKSGAHSLVQHARRHRDHFHVRFYNPRAQELGRRVQPLLSKDETTPQLVRHVIRGGDNLGKIARRYGVTIAQIKRTNRMRSDFIRAGRALAIPVRGRDCSRCGEVAEIYVPPRRLPPGLLADSALVAPAPPVPEANEVAAIAAAPAIAAEPAPTMVAEPAIARAPAPLAEVDPSAAPRAPSGPFDAPCELLGLPAPGPATGWARPGLLHPW